MNPKEPTFFHSMFSWRGSVLPNIAPRVILSVLYSLPVVIFHMAFGIDLGIGISPFEAFGVVIGLLLVFRINAGYDRWWEARKLLGSFSNHCKLFTLSTMQFVETNLEWKRQFASWIIVLPYTAKMVLRKEFNPKELSAFLEEEEIEQLLKTPNKMTYIGEKLAALLHEVYQKKEICGFVFTRLDQERVLLMEQIGACERILNSPPPLIIQIKVRRLLIFFILLIPFSLVPKLGWNTPFAMLFISYSLLALDQIGVELQSPFDVKNLNHLPLNELSKNIRKDLIDIATKKLRATVPLSHYYFFEEDRPT